MYSYQLAHVNTNINADCSNLAQGEPLCLGITGQDCTTTHVIVSGDGCYDLATTAGTDLTTLYANNPNVNADCSNIYPDEVSTNLHYAFAQLLNITRGRFSARQPSSSAIINCYGR